MRLTTLALAAAVLAAALHRADAVPKSRFVRDFDEQKLEEVRGRWWWEG
jgi:hypothetical protein